MTGLSCTGIYPFNQNIFTQSDLAPGYVRDRPNPTASDLIPSVLETFIGTARSFQS